MTEKEYQKFLWKNNIQVKDEVKFFNDNDTYKILSFQPSQKVLVKSLTTDAMYHKKVENITTVNNRQIQGKTINKKADDYNFDGGMAIYKRGKKYYLLNIDKVVDNIVFFKKFPAFEMDFYPDGTIIYYKETHPPTSFSINKLPGFTNRPKELHGQLEIPGMERRKPKGGYPLLFNATRQLKKIKDLMNCKEFLEWFRKNKDEIIKDENWNIQETIRNILMEQFLSENEDIKKMYQKLVKKNKKLHKKSNVTIPKGKGIHTQKFHKCVISVASKNNKVNPYAICMKQLGRDNAVKKSHRK